MPLATQTNPTREVCHAVGAYMAARASVTRQIALDTSYDMGRAAAQQGADYFTACPLTDPECRGRWADGFNSTRETAW